MEKGNEMSSLLRIVKYFQTLTAGAIATTTLTNPSTMLSVNMAGATGVQTVVLPASNNYAGEVCAIRVLNAVAVQTVVVQSPSGTTIDTFAASTNGARTYVFTGSAYVPLSVPA
jgi:hypothetical protein